MLRQFFYRPLPRQYVGMIGTASAVGMIATASAAGRYDCSQVNRYMWLQPMGIVFGILRHNVCAGGIVMKCAVNHAYSRFVVCCSISVFF
jgi:hypothetical protein